MVGREEAVVALENPSVLCSRLYTIFNSFSAGNDALDHFANKLIMNVQVTRTDPPAGMAVAASAQLLHRAVGRAPVCALVAGLLEEKVMVMGRRLQD